MPYQKPGVLSERTGLPGTPLGYTNFFISAVIAKTLGKTTQISRNAVTSGDDENLYVNGAMIVAGEALNYGKATYDSATFLTSALGQLPVLEILSVSTDHDNPYRREFVENTDFTVAKATGILDFTNAPAILPPEIDVIEQIAGGGAITNDTYNFAVIARDANGNTTIADTGNLAVGAGGGVASIRIKWGKVAKASSYLIYGKPSAATAAQYALLTTITSEDTTSYTHTVAIVAGALSLPATNTSKHTPLNGDYVYINYTYAAYNYDSPKRYFETETLQQDHGIGSEMANAGRIVLGPLGVGQNAGSMYAVAPETSNGEILGYQDAIEACESIQELILISTSSPSDTVNETLKAHCESMSTPENARERFCFLSTTAAVQSDSDVSAITNKIAALNGSNRAVYVVTEGGQPHIDAWQNTIDKYNLIDADTKTTNYTIDQAVDGPWHAIATMGRVASLADPATPPTNKQVYGISSGVEGTVLLWNDARKDTIAAAGGLLLEDRYNNLFVRHALTVSQASVEDSELSIVLAEAYMAKRLRDEHDEFVGKKITDLLLSGVEARTKKTLDALVGEAIIRSHENLIVYQDTAKPTWVYAVFDYRPIYPCNVIKFEWGFNLAG